MKNCRPPHIGDVKIDYTVQIWREGGQFIAHAMPLDVASSGESPDAARKAVDEAVQVFLASASAHGTVDEVLEESGYHKESGEWRAPIWHGIEQRLVEV